ncbi:MATE family efflux transporter [Candidatus Cardinium hertigii]|nr:MATE family efflux transporter [Candidatus Cardinium hertigii]ROT47698.1 hypothetical protein EDM02_01110 [Candidatus Cardinium hertigii]
MVRRYLEGISYGTIGLLLGFFTLITNVIFNFLLIYGKCGFPALELQGAGMAMVCAETLTAIAGILYLVCILRPKGYLMSFKFDQISWRYFKEILWVGWPAGIQFGIEGAYLFFIAMVVGCIGVEAQAAHAILFNLCQLITIFAVGLGLSGSMLVAQERGTQNGLLVRKIALAACDMITVFSIIIGLTFLTISPYIISFYKPVHIVKCLVSFLIKHLCIFQLFYGVCYWGNSVLRGLDDRAFPFVFNLITQFISAIICYILVIRYHWGISGVWLTLIFERMLLGLLLFFRFENKTKKSA